MRRGRLLEKLGNLFNIPCVSSMRKHPMLLKHQSFFAFSSLDPCKTQENLEPLGKDAGLKENICTTATLDTLKDVEMPKSSIEAFITPLEREREMARKREQERRRREAVSVCTSVEVRGWFQEHLNISSFSLTDIGH